MRNDEEYSFGFFFLKSGKVDVSDWTGEKKEWNKARKEGKEVKEESWSWASWKVFLGRCLFVGLWNSPGVYIYQPCHLSLSM